MIDFHTHCLHGIDDGSRDVGESIAIIERQLSKGVCSVVATPHFYPDHDKAVFVQQREEARQVLVQALAESRIQEPVLLLGAEVLLSVDTWKIEDLKDLAIEGTRYILLEMPYSHWSDWVFDSVQHIMDKHKLIPIIAHVERYDTVLENPNQLIKFLEMGALLQVNAYSLSKDSRKHKFVHKLIKHGMVHLIGSDVHRGNRFITVADGYSMIEKKQGKEVVQAMQKRGEHVLADEQVHIGHYTPFKKWFGWR